MNDKLFTTILFVSSMSVGYFVTRNKLRRDKLRVKLTETRKAI